MEKQIHLYLSQLAENPFDLQAMYDLERLLGQEQGRWSELARLLKEQADTADEVPKKARFLVLAGEIEGLRLGDAEAAEGLFEQALAMNGEGKVAAEVQIGRLSLKGDWPSVIESYQARFDSAPSDAVRVEVLCRMGFVFRDHLQDAKNAMKAFQTAFKLDRGCLVALRAAREIYSNVGNWKLVAQLLQLEIQALQKRGDRIGCATGYSLLGDALGRHLGQADIARNCYQNALKLDPENEAATRGMAFLDGEEVVEEAVEEAPSSDSEAPAEESVEVEEEDVEVEEAEDEDDEDIEIEVSEDDYVDLDEDEDVENDVEENEDEADEDVEIEVSEDDYVDLDEDEVEEVQEVAQEAAAEVVEEAAEPEAEASENEDEAVEEAAAEEIEEVAEEAVEEVEEAPEAVEEVAEEAAAEEVVEEAPAEETPEEEAAEAIEEVAEEVAAEVVEEAAEPEVEASENEGETVEEAAAEEIEEVAEEAVEEVEEAPEAVEEVAEEAVAEEEAAPEPTWRDGFEALLAAGGDDASGVQAALSLCADNDPSDGALIGALNQALGAFPEDDSHYEALRGRIADKAIWQGILGAYAGHEGGAVGRQVGRIQLYELGDYDAAKQTEESLGGESGDLVQELRDAKTASNGSWRRLQQELESRYEGLGKSEQAAEVYGRVAEFARAFGQTERRLDALRQHTQADPGAEAPRRQLKAIYRGAGKWQNYVEILKQEVGILDDEAKRSEALWEMVRVYRDELRQDVMVINTYNQMLQSDPSDVKVLDQLAAQYEKMRRFPDLIGVLQKRADASTTDAERVELHLKIANLFLGKFNNQAEAIKAFEKVLEFDSQQAEAIEFLKKMYDKRREYEKLINLHQSEIERLPDGEKGARFKDIAKLASSKLRKPGRATELWLAVLDFSPEDLEALEALEKLYEREKNWEKLVEIGERKFDLMENEAEKIKLAEKLGRFYGDRLDRPEDAARSWRRVLELAPTNRRAQDSLKRLLIDARDWDGLEAFFASTEDHKGHVRTLETLAGTMKEDEVKIELLFRAAKVWRESLEDTNRAVRALEKIKGIDETNAGAARMLAPIYEEAGDHRKLALALEVILTHLDPDADPVGALESLKLLARLNEEKLKHPEVAFMYYSRAFALAPIAAEAGGEVEEGEEAAEPSFDGAFADMERVAESLGSWDDLVAVYADKLDALEGSGDAQAELELRLRIGRVLNEELGRVEEALGYYEAVLAASKGELRALSAQEEIFQKTGNWDRLMEVYDRKLSLSGEPSARIAILQSKATILDEYKGDFHGAVACHLEVVDLDPTHRASLGSLHGLYEQLGDYEALAGIIRREIALSEASPLSEIKGVDGQPLTGEEAQEAGVLAEGTTLDDLILLKLQLGIVAASALPESHGEAVEAFRDVLAAQPDNEAALEQLEALGHDDALSLSVADILEPLYNETHNWESLVASREVQLEHMSEDEVESRVGKLLSIGEVLVTQLSDFERGFGAYGRALRAQPTSEPASERLEQISEATGDWTGLVALMEDIIPGLSDPDLTHSFLTRVALAIEGQLEDQPRAQDAWRRVLDFNAEDEQALGHLEDLYMNGQQWHELDEVYERMQAILQGRAASVEEGDEAGQQEAAKAARELSFKQAMLHEEMLEDATGAIEIYQSILSTEPNNLRACQAMDRLLGNEGRFEDLAHNIEQQLALVSAPDEVRQLKCRLAYLKETQLYQVPEAIALYGEVLSQEPAHEQALEALERLISTEPDHQLAIADVLEPLYRDGEQWEKLIETLEIRIAADGEPAQRVVLLHQVSSLYEEKLAQLGPAFTTMRRALGEDVHNEASMGGLYRLAEQIDAWEALVGALEEEVTNAMDPGLAASLDMRIAALQEDKLGDVAGATDHYCRVLENQPEQVEAINHLERIYKETAQWEALVDILKRKVPLTDDDSAQKDLLYQAATILEEMLEQPAEAIEVYEQALLIDEADAVSIDQLDRLYTDAERWPDLIELCERKQGLAGGDEDRRALFFRVAELYEHQIGDADRAIETWRAALELNEGDVEALARLDGLYAQTEQWGYLQETLERQLTLSDDPVNGLVLRHRIGELWERHLSDPVRAVEVYKGILAESPDFIATLEALEGMVERREEQAAAADVLRPIYRDTEQWDKLIDLYEVLVESRDGDVLGQAELLGEIGQICELRLEDGMSAFTAYGRALSLTPENEGLTATLERLASELDCWEALVDLLEERLGSLHDMEVARQLALRIGRILEEEMMDRARAIDRFKMVLDLDPSDETAVKSLDRLYEQEGRWEDLAQVLNEEILQEDDDAARTALRFRLGALYETALEDVDQAIAAYHEILMGDADHEGAREALERMFSSNYAPMQIGAILAPWYEERAKWDQLVEVYVVQLDHKTDPDERFSMLHQIAALYRDRLSDHESAFTVLGSALGERPGDEETIELLEGYADVLDAWQELAGFYTDALERSEDLEEQQRLLLKIAQIMDLKLGEMEAAEQAYTQVLQMDDTDQVALDALDRIYTQQARWPELAQIITREIELLMDEEKVVSLSYRLGTLLEHQLGDLDRAVATYNNLLGIQPSHPEALMALEGIYRIREEWEPLFMIYERQADLLDEDQASQAEVYAKMASLAENMLMRPLDSIDLWNRVLDLRGEDVSALQALSALYQREGQHGDLVQVMEREVRVTQDPERQVALWAYIGGIWRDHLLNDDRSLEAWRQVLDLDPTNVQALFACRDLYQRIGDYEALVGIVDQLIMEEDAIGSENMLELYIQLGEIQGNLLRNQEEAVKAWTAVLALEPTHRLALDSLEELYSDMGAWEACVDVLSRKVEVLEAAYEAKYGIQEEPEGDEDEEEIIDDPMLDEQIELQLQIADIWESKIQQRDSAVLAYEAVLDIDPGHMQASRALEGLYSEQEAWDKLVELYLVRQEYIEDQFEGLEILRNASRIYEERLGNKEAAFLVLCRAFMENHEDEQTAVDLERLARETESWETLVNLYYNVLEEMDEGPDSMSLHIKVARWWADELGDRDKAIDHYQKAMALAPDNTDVMGALEGIYEKSARWEELVRIMELRAELTPEDDIRMELWRKIGDVYDLQLQDIDKSVDAYRTILRIDPTDVGAMGSLEGIYERTERWTELIDVLERKSEVIFEPDQVVEIKHRIAQLWEVEVGSIERAVEAYRSVLGIETTHLPSLEALERLYRHLEKWPELQEIYFMQLSMAEEAATQVSIYGRAAQVYEAEMGDVESAVEAYGKIMLVDPLNLGAITELERLYTDLQRWDDLYQTLERHVEAVPESAARVDLYHMMGQVCRDHLADVHRAIEAYRRVLELDAFNVEALYELANLYELASDWEACLAVYESLAEVVTDPEAGVELHYRMGRIKEENLIDPEGAEQRYRFALEIDPSYKPAIDALRGMYERGEDWSGVISMLKQEEEFTRDLEQKAALLSRIGQIYEHALGDEIRALDYYEQTIDLAPENVEAAEPLSKMYLREQRWARAWPLLDLLVRHHGHDHGREDLYLLHYNLGLCCEELGQEDRALKEYGEAYEFSPNYLPTLMGMGRLLFKRGDYDRSYKIYRTITRHHADSLTEEQMTEIHARCGDIKRRLGDVESAMEMYDAALQSTPGHSESLQALVDLTTEAGRWDHAVAYRQRQLALMTDELERYDALLKMGDTLYQHLNNPAQAVEMYRQALEVQPDSVVVLRKLLDIYTQSQMWTDAVAVLSRIAELEQDPGRKSKYFYTVAVIFRDEVGDMMRSVEFFNRSLDYDVSMLKAFEAIDRILTSEHAWKELERSYRKMLHRVKDLPSSPEMDGLKLLLWKNLGEIYRSRQGNYDAAIEAYKVAGALRPDDHNIHEILADLYERSGNHPEEAIDEHKRLIAMKPFRIESYRALFNTYMKTQLYDEAWCMASALTFLNSATQKEQEFYQNYLGQGPATPQRPLSPDHWKMIYHVEQDMLISNIMALIAVYMRKNYYAFEHKVWTLHKRKDLMQPNPQLAFWRIYQWTAQTLAVNPAPNVYLKRDQMAPMRNGNLEPPAFIVGNTLFQNAQDREVAFIIGKQLGMARPEHYLGSGFFPTENLKVLFMAAMQLTNPALGLGRGNPEFVDVVQRMQKVPPPVLIQLRKFMQQYLNTGRNPNLSAWLKAVDHTTNRVGLLMCGDLLQAANSVKTEQVPISKLTVKEKIKELVLFSISDQYFQLRKELGLALRSG